MQKQGRKITEMDLGLEKKVSVLVCNGHIVWIGKNSKLATTKSISQNLAQDKRFLEFFRGNKKNKFFSQSEIIQALKKINEVDCQGRTMLPGFVECHTHSIFSGDRTQEFEWKMQGVSYQEIASRGGGILSTMQATRRSNNLTLMKDTQSKINAFVQQGVTALEIKSGYALSENQELKILKVLNQLIKNNQKIGPQIIPTFLGAHAIPPEYKKIKNPEEKYLQDLKKTLHKIKKNELANRVDIFVEKGFFESKHSNNYLQYAKELGFDICIHADQITLSGGTELGLSLGALSVDHVLQISEKQIQTLGQSPVTAVLLPTADLYMKCQYPKARKMIDENVRVAIATDFNPGTAPSPDITLAGLLARLQMGMTLPEVITAYTVGASFALNLQSKMGALTPYRQANFSLLNADWTSVFYSPGDSKIHQVFRLGNIIHNA